MPDPIDASVVQKVLKYHPRGLTITDIARKARLSRNVAAKYLEVMRAEGKVDARPVGPSRVYSLSQRVPLSAFLCFTQNLIVIVDDDRKIVQVNSQFEKFSGMRKEDLVGRYLHEAQPPIVSTPGALAIIGSMKSEQVITEVQFRKGNADLDFRMEVIPTTFDAGDTGLTIVLQDITERKRHLRNMEFLARTAMELVDLPADADIFRYIADRVAELVPYKPKIFVESYDELNRQFFIRAVIDREFRENIAKITGFDVVGKTMPLEEFFFAAPFFESPSSLKSMREMHFRPYYEDEYLSFYDACVRQFPKEVCDTLVRELEIAAWNLTGLVWREQLFGVVGIVLGPGETIENRQAIESFLRQASIAISRRMEEERLARSERRFSDLVDQIGQAAVVIGSDGKILQVTRQFSTLSGYGPEDIATMKDWLDRAFPDPGTRAEAEALSGPGTAGPAGNPEKSILMRCKSGEARVVTPESIVLSDGTRVVALDPLTGGKSRPSV